MSENNASNDEQNNVPNEGDAENADNQNPATDPPEGEENETPAPEGEDDIQDRLTKAESDAAHWRSELDKARKEAARRRVEKNDAQAQNKSLEERIAELELEKADREQALVKERVSSKRQSIAHEYGLPDDSIDLLGDDLEKMEDIAKKLSALRGPTQKNPPFTPNPRGGVHPEQPGEISVADARKAYYKSVSR